MLNSIAAGWRYIAGQALYQAAGVALVALVALGFGPRQAAAVAVAGGTLIVASLVSARFALAGGAQMATSVVLRLAVSVVLKWLLVAVMLLLAIVAWKLPPLALLAGVVAALVCQVLAVARTGPAAGTN